MRSAHIYLLILGIIFIPFISIAQKKTIKKIEKQIGLTAVSADMKYLASDELKGRKTGEPGNQMAARYIAEAFQKAGVKTVPGMSNYFQTIPFVKFSPPADARILFNGVSFTSGANMVVMDGAKVDQNLSDAVYANFGWVGDGQDDYAGLDVKGKYVVLQSGLPHVNSPMEIFNAMPQKRSFAKERGALGIIELYNLNVPWNFFKNYFNKERLEVTAGNGSDAALFHAYIQVPNTNKPNFAEQKTWPIEIYNSGSENKKVDAVNVIGYVPGKNKLLRDQYLLLTAHFDHVGVNAGNKAGTDSIWNGARDNAWGTVGLLAAAKYFANNPPERSILLAAVNGEEIGLLGSAYLAEHPVLPWNKVIFNLNSDGAGYADTTLVSVIGLNRVGASTEIMDGCKAFGLGVIADPAPEQGLFDRSDNVSFAKLGIPAPTFASGFKNFDESVFKYYHQAIDNPDNISYGYLLSFTKAFVYSGWLIANKKTAPRWISGDKYESAGKNLYKY